MAHPSWGKFKTSSIWSTLTRPMQQGAWKIFKSLDNAVGQLERKELMKGLDDEEREGAGLFLLYLRRTGQARCMID